MHSRLAVCIVCGESISTWAETKVCTRLVWHFTSSVPVYMCAILIHRHIQRHTETHTKAHRDTHCTNRDTHCTDINVHRYVQTRVFDNFWNIAQIGSKMVSVCAIGNTSWAN